MGDYNRDRRSGGSRNYGRNDYDRRGYSGGNRGGSREMFKAVCSNCGKDCEVPFRPTGSKPVLCSDCFEKSGGSSSRNYERRGDSRPPQGAQNNDKLEEINQKLDRILEMLSSRSKTVSKETPSSEEKIVTKKPRAKAKPSSK